MPECHECGVETDGTDLLCAKCSFEYANEPSQFEQDNPTYARAAVHLMADVPERWVQMFGEGWHSVPEGQPGDRRRAGLALVLADLRRGIAMDRECWTHPDAKRALDDILDLIDGRSGGNAEPTPEQPKEWVPEYTIVYDGDPRMDGTHQRCQIGRFTTFDGAREGYRIVSDRSLHAPKSNLRIEKRYVTPWEVLDGE